MYGLQSGWPGDAELAVYGLHHHGIGAQVLARQLVAGARELHAVAAGRVPPSGMSISSEALRMESGLRSPYFLSARGATLFNRIQVWPKPWVAWVGGLASLNFSL